jgi:hypothetical protein
MPPPSLVGSADHHARFLASNNHMPASGFHSMPGQDKPIFARAAVPSCIIWLSVEKCSYCQLNRHHTQCALELNHANMSPNPAKDCH